MAFEKAVAVSRIEDSKGTSFRRFKENLVSASFHFIYCLRSSYMYTIYLNISHPPPPPLNSQDTPTCFPPSSTVQFLLRLFLLLVLLLITPESTWCWACENKGGSIYLLEHEQPNHGHIPKER